MARPPARDKAKFTSGSTMGHVVTMTLTGSVGLIAVFAERHGVDAQGERQANYYVQESVGIACGMLITALHHAGLATLTHTPSPMAFLGELLERPSRERAVMLVVAGHPAAGAQVPVITKKPLHEIATFR